MFFFPSIYDEAKHAGFGYCANELQISILCLYRACVRGTLAHFCPIYVLGCVCVYANVCVSVCTLHLLINFKHNVLQTPSASDSKAPLNLNAYNQRRTISRMSVSVDESIHVFVGALSAIEPFFSILIVLRSHPSTSRWPPVMTFNYGINWIYAHFYSTSIRLGIAEPTTFFTFHRFEQRARLTI